MEILKLLAIETYIQQLSSSIPFNRHLQRQINDYDESSDNDIEDAEAVPSPNGEGGIVFKTSMNMAAAESNLALRERETWNSRSSLLGTAPLTSAYDGILRDEDSPSDVPSQYSDDGSNDEYEVRIYKTRSLDVMNVI